MSTAGASGLGVDEGPSSSGGEIASVSLRVTGVDVAASVDEEATTGVEEGSAGAGMDVDRVEDSPSVGLVRLDIS